MRRLLSQIRGENHLAKSQLENRLKELEKEKARGILTDEEYATRRTAIVATAGEAPAKGGAGRGIFKWGMLGCLGIFAATGALVIAVIVIIVVALGSAANDLDDGDGSSGDVRVALAEGTSGVISPAGSGSKQTKVTILKVVDGAAPGNEFFKAAAGKNYLGIEVLVENVGTKEITSPSWKLRDSKDFEHDRTFFSDIGPNLETLFNLTPGAKLQGWVVFEIDADATVKWIRADPNVILKNDLYFDAK